MYKLSERQRAHFDGISETYRIARENPNHILLRDLIWRDFLGRNAHIAPEIKRVLEPMCGMAEGYEILKNNWTKDFDYHGFDYSQAMVEAARKRNPALDIEWRDVTSYQSSGVSFDCIILIGGLHHVYDFSSDVIRRLGEALRPGGFFLNFEPTHNSCITRRIRERIYKSNSLFDAETERGFEYRDLTRHFERAGYTKVDEVYPGLLSYIFYYNPDAFPILNIGGKTLVRALFSFDKLLWRNWLGRKLSFATITLWRRG